MDFLLMLLLSHFSHIGSRPNQNWYSPTNRSSSNSNSPFRSAAVSRPVSPTVPNLLYLYYGIFRSLSFNSIRYMKRLSESISRIILLRMTHARRFWGFWRTTCYFFLPCCTSCTEGTTVSLEKRREEKRRPCPINSLAKTRYLYWFVST